MNIDPENVYEIPDILAVDGTNLVIASAFVRAWGFQNSGGVDGQNIY